MFWGKAPMKKECDEYLKFVNKVISGATHELNNVFSIINEVVGSIADKLDSSGSTTISEMGISKKTEKIQNHIQRGKNLVKALNNFSHQTDYEKNIFNLKNYLDDFIILHRYFFIQKGCNVTLINLSQNPEISSNEFQLSFITHLIVMKLVMEQTTCPEIKIVITSENNLEIHSQIQEDFLPKLLDLINYINQTISDVKIDFIAPDKKIIISL